jgi:tetratricopeptide (TPR) repeat protein
MYVPSIVIAIVVGLGMARLRLTRHVGTLAVLTTAGALAALALLTRSQTQYWKDSIVLWTRAAELDPRNDVATYNLAEAFAEAGHDREAMQWYERTLVLVPPGG